MKTCNICSYWVKDKNNNTIGKCHCGDSVYFMSIKCNWQKACEEFYEMFEKMEK